TTENYSYHSLQIRSRQFCKSCLQCATQNKRSTRMQLIISAGVILLIVAWGIIAPQSLGGVFDSLLGFITVKFGWLYLWIVLGLVVVAGLLAFSRYGDLKLGAEDEEPEFSLHSWFAMLFAAGMGIGLVFWGVAEPI